MRPRGGGDWRKEGVPAVTGLAHSCKPWTLIYHTGAPPVFSSLLISLTCSLLIVPNKQKKESLAGKVQQRGRLCIVTA